MKTFLTLEVRKSVLIKFAFRKSFGKVNLLNLVESNFLDLANFAMVNRFSILLPLSLLLLLSSTSSHASWWPIWIPESHHKVICQLFKVLR